MGHPDSLFYQFAANAYTFHWVQCTEKFVRINNFKERHIFPAVFNSFRGILGIITLGYVEVISVRRFIVLLVLLSLAQLHKYI